MSSRKFNVKLTDDRNGIESPLQETDMWLLDIEDVVKLIKQEWGVKIRKVYDRNEDEYHALVNGNRYLDICAWEPAKHLTQDYLLVLDRPGSWRLRDYLNDWGFGNDDLAEFTPRKLLEGIWEMIEADNPGDCDELINAGYEDGDEYTDSWGRVFEVHEITLTDCERVIEKAIEEGNQED